MGTLLFVLAINGGITLVVVLVTPLSLFVASFVARLSNKYVQKQSKTQESFPAMWKSSSAGKKVVKAFGLKTGRRNALGDQPGLSIRCQITGLFLSQPDTRFVNSIVYAAVGGHRRAQRHRRSFGRPDFLLLSYANQYTKPFNEVTGVLTQLRPPLPPPSASLPCSTPRTNARRARCARPGRL